MKQKSFSIMTFGTALRILLLSFLLTGVYTVSAVQPKVSANLKITPVHKHADTCKLGQPSPMADDSPINPASGQKKAGSGQAKKKTVPKKTTVKNSSNR